MTFFWQAYDFIFYLWQDYGFSHGNLILPPTAILSGRPHLNYSWSQPKLKNVFNVSNLLEAQAWTWFKRRFACDSMCANQIAAILPKLWPCQFPCVGKCLSISSCTPIYSICVNSMGKSSTRSFVIMGSVGITSNIYLLCIFGKMSLAILIYAYFS